MDVAVFSAFPIGYGGRVSVQLVFDDTLAVPETLTMLAGVQRFGNLVFRKATRVSVMRQIAHDAGWPPMIHLCDRDDVSALARRLRDEEDDNFYLICPAQLVPICGQQNVTTFLQQIQYAPSCLYMPLEGANDHRCWSLLRAGLLRKYLSKHQEGAVAEFFEQHGDGMVEIRDRLELIDVSDERNLLDFLSGQYDARHFNSVERDEFTVIKRSHDRTKLKREFEFYKLIPPQMQMFHVQPFDFQDDGQIASYRMERVAVPDMAMQWLHGAFKAAEFERFLQHIFHFIAQRPERRVEQAKFTAVMDALYVEKVTSRIAALKASAVYGNLVPYFDRAFGGIDALVQRYLTLFARMRRAFPDRRLVIGHGDPCFSNILYSKTNQYLKLVDPRGADNDDDLYTDPYYDVAKLSHSVLGGYDFINQEKLDLTVDDELGLSLELQDPPPDWARTLFFDRLKAIGYDPTLTRLCEASLFISMLPLHIDRPRSVVGFAIMASNILDAIEGIKGRTL